MANFDNFSLMSQIPPRTVSAPAPAPQAAPQSAPQQNMPFGFLTPLFDKIGMYAPESSMGPLNVVGGLLGSLFGGKKKATPAPTNAVIDKRPDDVQRLVSMYSNGGL